MLGYFLASKSISNAIKLVTLPSLVRISNLKTHAQTYYISTQITQAAQICKRVISNEFYTKSKFKGVSPNTYSFGLCFARV